MATPTPTRNVPFIVRLEQLRAILYAALALVALRGVQILVMGVALGMDPLLSRVLSALMFLPVIPYLVNRTRAECLRLEAARNPDPVDEPEILDIKTHRCDIPAEELGRLLDGLKEHYHKMVGYEVYRTGPAPTFTLKFADSPDVTGTVVGNDGHYYLTTLPQPNGGM